MFTVFENHCKSLILEYSERSELILFSILTFMKLARFARKNAKMRLFDILQTV